MFFTAIIVAAVLCFLYFLSSRSGAIYEKGESGKGWLSAGYYFWYWPRWLYCFFLIKIDQLSKPARLNNYDRKSFSHDDCGFVPTPSEQELETPKQFLTGRHENSILIWGSDSEKRFVVAKVVRLPNRRASVFVCIKNKDGSLYTLPNQPDSSINNVDNGERWIGAGLLLECVEPMRTWRLKYNGFLRKGIRDEYITEDELDDDDQESTPIYHAQLDFLWKAARAPVDIWADSSAGLLADVLAGSDLKFSSLFTSLERDGYDQWGALHGTIKLGQYIQEEWYLRGCRQHRWGMSDGLTSFAKSINFFAVFESGQFSWVELFSYDSGLPRCLLGYTHTSAGAYLPVTYINHSWSTTVADCDAPFPKNFTFEVKFGNSKKFYWYHPLDRGCQVYTGDPWSLKHDIRPTYVVFENFQGSGLIIISNRFRGLCPVPEKEDIRFPKPVNRPSTTMPLVVNLGSDLCRLHHIAGGKGSSLAFLSSTCNNNYDVNFLVPPGVVITNTAWEQHISKKNELSSALKYLQKAVVSSQVPLLKNACNKIVALINNSSLSEELTSCLETELNSLFPEGLSQIKFAVRSSACFEDSEEASAAGQNDTYLGCFWESNYNGSAGERGKYLETTLSGRNYHKLKSCEDEVFETDNYDIIKVGKTQQVELPSSETSLQSLYKSKLSVKKAITKCWASQFSFQSIEYRRQRGQPLNGGMAVVVQLMVSPDAAGVIFTRDPVDGNPGKITLSANYGLGEIVVSGISEPDRIEISRTWRDKLRITSKVVGEKKTKFVIGEEENISKVEVDCASSSKICVSDDVAIDLAKIAIHIEKLFGSPRDIEFAIRGNHIYILQSRTITSLYGWTDYEIMHEFDTPIISDQEINTVANTGEVFPGYTTPLTLSTVVKALDMSMQERHNILDYPNFRWDPCCYRLNTVTCNKPMLNIGELMLRINGSELDMSNHSVDLSVVGRVVTTPEIHSWAKRRYGFHSTPKLFLKGIPTYYDVVFIGSKLRRHAVDFSSYSIECSRAQSAAALYQKISSRLSDLLQISSIHTRTSSVSTFSQFLAMRTLSEGRREVTDDLIEDIALLLGGISQTESGNVPTAMKALAREISSTSDASDFVSMTTDEAKVWLQTDPGVTGRQFRLFVGKHGHRCIKEFDYRSLSWGMSSTSLVEALQKMVRNPESLRSDNRKKSIGDVMDRLQTPLKASTRRSLRFILGLCKKAVNQRETSKSLLIKTVDGFRKAYKALGQLLVSECRLPDADLIFFLQHQEVGQLIANRSVTLLNKAIKRRKLMTTIENFVFEEIMFGVPRPINIEKDSVIIDETEDGNVVLKGSPVCHGIARGPARIVTDLEDANLIQNGDILVTYCTDVGWTPYFPLLSGVVTEIGGLISHGAVVAREYGLPCVVGIKGATRILASGDELVLDGGRGRVQRSMRKKEESGI